MKYLKFKLSLLILALLVSTAVFAQGKSNNKSENNSTLEKGPHAFKKGGVDWNIGLGFISRYSPQLYTSLDFGVTENISVGIYFAYTQAKFRLVGSDLHQGILYNYTINIKENLFIPGIRGAYHFGDLIGEENLDVYAGLMLGSHFLRSTFTYEDSYKTRNNNTLWKRRYNSFLGLYAGGRYFFTDKIGVYGEFGWGVMPNFDRLVFTLRGVTYANIGLTLKLK